MTTQPDQEPRRRIVVGVDGSNTSRAALRWAADEAEAHDAELETVTVLQPPLPLPLLGPTGPTLVAGQVEALEPHIGQGEKLLEQTPFHQAPPALGPTVPRIAPTTSTARRTRQCGSDATTH
jgi:hypothetical protein